MGSNYFPAMISDSGDWGIAKLLIPRKSSNITCIFFSFLCGRGWVLNIDPSVPSESVHA